MSLSTPTLKFLIDENVHSGLVRFLKEKGFDVKVCPKGATDAFISRISVEENRILITNDSDFAGYSKEKLYGLVLLKLSQGDRVLLEDCFERLLVTKIDLENKIVVCYFNKQLEFDLGSKPEL